MTLLLIMIGGAAGAAVRHLVDRLLTRQSRAGGTKPARPFPRATLAVNVAGSFILGLLAGLGDGVPGAAGALLGAGFCGALTTWSTFAFQTLEAVPRRLAVLNVAATLVLGLGAASLGRTLTL